MYLPAKPGDPRALATAEAIACSPATVLLRGRRILIAEDEGLLALDLEFALIDAGATVLGPIGRVDEGLDLILADTGQIDAAILDLDLRGLPVFPVADELKRREIPFVFHTGHGRETDLLPRYGPETRVFLKPTRMERMIAVIAEMIVHA